MYTILAKENFSRSLVLTVLVRTRGKVLIIKKDKSSLVPTKNVKENFNKSVVFIVLVRIRGKMPTIKKDKL